jgi:hypothetical protein
MKFKNAIVEEVTFVGTPGTGISETIIEVFDWFYAGDGREVKRCYIRHLNGVICSFQREGDVIE